MALQPTSSEVSSTTSHASERLRAVGLRPTRQRVALYNIIFGSGERHLSAEELYQEARRSTEAMSLATVYNTLRQFSETGLIRPLPTEGYRAYFDTNTSLHHHFLVESDGRLIDIPEDRCRIVDPPPPPEGFDVVGIDVVVRLRCNRSSE